MSEISAETILTPDLSQRSNVVGQVEPIAPRVEQKSKDVVYGFYHDYLAPFIVSLSVSVLDKLKADPSLRAAVFRRDGIQIDVALQKLRQLPEYLEVSVGRIQRLDLTKSVMNASLRDPEQLKLVEVYLDQAGLRDGSPILFVDTGFNNTIPRRLKEDFLPSATQSDSMFLVSMNEQATGLIYNHQSAYTYPGDQAMKSEAGAIVTILESLGKGVRKNITRLVQDGDGRVRGEFLQEENEEYRHANLSALRAISDYIDEQQKDKLLEAHRGDEVVNDARRKMEERIKTLSPSEKTHLKL